MINLPKTIKGEIDDVDDDLFLRKRSCEPNSEGLSFLTKKQSELLEKRRELERKMVRSTETSLSLLSDSESVGKTTMVELSRQREQLEQAERRLDKMGSLVRINQRYLRNMRSLFASVKDYMLRRKPFREEAVDWVPVKEEKKKEVLERRVARVPPERLSCGDVVEDNLGMMLESVSSLRGLSLDMANELDTQNGLIDCIVTKTEDVDASIVRQHKEINKLLK